MGCAAGLWVSDRGCHSALCCVFSCLAPPLKCRPPLCSLTKPEKVHVIELPPNMFKGIQAWINWGLPQHSLFALAAYMVGG